jgi:hypothetical protein
MRKMVFDPLMECTQHFYSCTFFLRSRETRVPSSVAGWGSFGFGSPKFWVRF